MIEFQDISSEKIRTYVFIKEGDNIRVRINQPSKLNVSSSGGHRIIDKKGIGHYIPTGWVHLFWKVSEGPTITL